MAGQIRRTSASVAANSAEGNGRETTATYIQFLRVAQGSLKELETHRIRAQRVVQIGDAARFDPLTAGKGGGVMTGIWITATPNSQLPIRSPARSAAR